MGTSDIVSVGRKPRWDGEPMGYGDVRHVSDGTYGKWDVGTWDIAQMEYRANWT